jgi:hypothetical protein
MASEAILLTVMIRCTARVDLSSAATVYPLVLQQLMKFGMKKRKNENVGCHITVDLRSSTTGW